MDLRHSIEFYTFSKEKHIINFGDLMANFSFDDPDQAENDYTSSNDGGFESGNSAKTSSNLEQELLSSD